MIHIGNAFKLKAIENDFIYIIIKIKIDTGFVTDNTTGEIQKLSGEAQRNNGPALTVISKIK